MNAKVFISVLVLGSSCLWTSAQEYSKHLQKIATEKEIFKSSDSPVVIQQASTYLFKQLTQNVFPAWYGTPWDFNGISNTPKAGEIACGYFVTTTLKHVGFNLNRYKLAQQDAATIAKNICGTNHCQWYNDMDVMIGDLSSKPDGLYVLGLDYHVGFLSKEGDSIYFIHSDFYSGKVIREYADYSESLLLSERYYLGSLTDNKEAIRQWLNNIKIY